jgi:EAL and modified HD-GYP domain-containing signal transduction protein
MSAAETHPAAPGTRMEPGAAGDEAGMIRRVRVGRQGIHDANRHVVAYELLFSSGVTDRDGPGVSEQATSQVIASTFGTFGLDTISDGRPLFINVTRAFLTGMIPIPIPPGNVIIEITEQIDADHELLLGLADLRRAGYRIAVDNYSGDLARAALVEIADFIKIRVNSLPTVIVPGLVEQCRGSGATLLATGIEDEETFRRCVDLGFDMYQGLYLQKATFLEQRTLLPSQLICVRLLNDLSDPRIPIARIEQMVGSDPGLTLRLLRTANSAAAGVTREITSLRQALVLIGQRMLRSWVVLTLMEGNTVQESSDELWTVLARAHTCQRLAPQEPDLAFTVGLLSGAAQMLGSDPADIAEGAGIGYQTRLALLEEEGEAGRALSAVLAHERDDALGVQEAGFMPFDVSRVYLEALSDSLTLVHDLIGDESEDTAE